MCYNSYMRKNINTLEDQIIRAVKDRGLTSYRLGIMSGVSNTIISRFLRRERTLTLKTASKLVAAMELELKPKSKE